MASPVAIAKATMAEHVAAGGPVSPNFGATTSISERMTFLQSNVAAKIGDEVDEATYIAGTLKLVERATGIFIDWTPTVEEPTNESVNSDWVVTPPTGVVSFNNSHSPSESVEIATLRAEKAEQLKRLAFSVDIKDLMSFQCHEKHKRLRSSPWIRLVGKCGSNYIPLHFRDGGLTKFIEALQQYAALKRSAKEPNLVLFVDESAELLQQSVTALFSRENQPDFFSRLMSNPYNTAMTQLGRVTTLLHDHASQMNVTTTTGAILNAMSDFDALNDEEREAFTRSLQARDKEASDNLRLHDGDSGFEVVTKLELPDRPIVRREAAMGAEQWRSFKTADGRIKNTRELKLLIFRGGLCPQLRQEAWMYLLGYYQWNSTTHERQELRKERVDSYFRMKLQWKSITEDQEERFAEFRDRKALVDKDVTRTDRTHRFFEGDNNANVSKLYDILMTYVMYNFDLGYVQGMSDCLSPILVVMENEVDAFWCFVGLMQRMHKNFEMDQKTIRSQLMQLRDLLMVVNPRLANYLESHHSDNMYFCFRWVLIVFKREFSFASIMRLWEVFWTDLPCKNFHLLMCVAILDQQMHTIIANKFGLTEILKHVNDLSMHIDLEDMLSVAEAIYHQLAATQDKLPAHVCEILGFTPYGNNQTSATTSGSHNGTPEKVTSNGKMDGSPVCANISSDGFSDLV